MSDDRLAALRGLRPERVCLIKPSALGDVVNACSRMESTICKPDQIVVSRATLDRAKKAVETAPLGAVSLRGRRAEMEIFEIL